MHLDTADRAALAALAARTIEQVDRIAGELLACVVAGDDTALMPLADRLEEIGRPEQAERFRRLAAE